MYDFVTQTSCFSTTLWNPVGPLTSKAELLLLVLVLSFLLLLRNFYFLFIFNFQVFQTVALDLPTQAQTPSRTWTVIQRWDQTIQMPIKSEGIGLLSPENKSQDWKKSFTGKIMFRDREDVS